MLRRIKFGDMFQESGDGGLALKSALEVNGVTFSPGANFQKGVAYGGIDFHLYKYRDVAVDADDTGDGPLKLLGFYQD